ncbi:hypothetical protein SAMN07250955_102361 [Arboricoccus pini]|uniref:Uncharacterized protein n=1 Tax=Arboricoccus pini TaxID=1963835 RepID=A0A212QQF2_9PROT|nr:hypothetical protein [Arboricoccus pini]SNB61709.1 hypothetical protein SAMN07250955_102361 [Arboricoccus pini]
MTLLPTLALFCLALAAIGLAIRTERRTLPPGALRAPSTLLLALGVVGGILLLAHLVTLTTGLSLPGRAGF